MLVIRVELWSAITGEKKQLGLMTICNTGGNSNQSRGDYYVRVGRKDSAKKDDWREVQSNPLRTGSVSDFPRKSYNLWRLVLRALKDSFPEETKQQIKD